MCKSINVIVEDKKYQNKFNERIYHCSYMIGRFVNFNVLYDEFIKLIENNLLDEYSVVRIFSYVLNG